MEYFEFAKSLSLECGKRMKDAFDIGALGIEEKDGMADLVTKSDKEIEDYSKSEILKTYSNHKFIGEESISGGAKCELTDAPTWILDPIDGTTNFVNRFPFFCYSLGLYVNKKAVLGIVYNSILNEFYHAIRGQGAYLNNQPIHVSKTEELIKSIAFSDWGNDRDLDKIDIRVENMRNVVLHSRGVRSLGSAAMHLCKVAAGSCDIYYEFGVHCWDMAAGCLIVEEAGGVCTLCDGAPLDIMQRQVIASCSPKLTLQVAAIIKRVPYPSD